MKYLITESQFTNTIKKLINDTLIEFRNVCEDYDESQEPGDWYNWDDCDSLESIKKIEVVNVQNLKLTKGLKKYPTFGVDINIHFSNVFASKDFSDFLIALAYRIKQKYKVTLMFNENELINTNTDRQW